MVKDCAKAKHDPGRMGPFNDWYLAARLKALTPLHPKPSKEKKVNSSGRNQRGSVRNIGKEIAAALEHSQSVPLPSVKLWMTAVKLLMTVELPKNDAI